jgi:hypothetical protein
MKEGRYVRNVKPGERFDPTMTGVDDVTVFRVGDFIRSHSGYDHIIAIDEAPFGKPDTRFIHLFEMGQMIVPLAGEAIHDLRENDTRNFYYNGMSSDGRAPADVMTFEEAKHAYEQALNDAACS